MRHKDWMKSFIAGMALTLCVALFGQDTSDSLRVDFTKRAETAKKQNYRNLGDMLNDLPGVWMRETGSVGQWTSLNISGWKPESVRILLDGRPLTDPWSGLADLSLIPSEMIEAITVHPSMNSLDQPAGPAINLKSRGLTVARPYTKIVYRSGSTNFSDLDITFGQKLSPRFEIISGVLLKKYGELLTDRTFKGSQIRSKITAVPLTGLTLRYSILRNTSDLDLPFPFAVPGDTTVFTSPTRDRDRWDHAITADWTHGSAQTTAGWDHTADLLDFQQTGDAEHGRKFSVKHTAVWIRHQTTMWDMPVSASIHLNHRTLAAPDSSDWSDTLIRSNLQVKRSISRQIDARFQANPQISSDGRFRFPLSVQAEWTRLQGTIVWAALSQDVRDPSLAEQSGSAFPPVNGMSLFGQAGPYPSFSSHSDLKPENSVTLETGVRTTWRGAQARLRGYVTSLQDRIQLTQTDQTLRFDNADKMRLWGLESHVSSASWRGLQTSWTANLLNAQDIDISERPAFWGAGHLAWQHAFFDDDLVAILLLGCRFWSRFQRYRWDGSDAVTLETQPSGFCLDAKLTCVVIRNATISFAMDNILGSDITFVSPFWMPKQVYRIGFSWELYD